MLEGINKDASPALGAVLHNATGKMSMADAVAALSNALAKARFPYQLRRIRDRMIKVANEIEMPPDHVDKILDLIAKSKRRYLLKCIMRNLHFRPEFQEW